MRFRLDVDSSTRNPIRSSLQSYSDSSLGCSTLSDYEEADRLEDEVEQAEGEEETEEKRRLEREANEDEPCHKRRRDDGDDRVEEIFSFIQ